MNNDFAVVDKNMYKQDRIVVDKMCTNRIKSKYRMMDVKIC